MPFLALIAVLLAAVTHSTWNLAAKKAASSRHFVWLYSIGSIVLYCPIIGWLLYEQRPQFGALQWLALTGTSVLHLGYSLALQAGYRVSDLSLVYPIARGSGPLLSFVGATILLGEQPTVLAGLGLVLIVAGILLVAGLTREPHRAPKVGIFFGLLTGAFIASYTVNDGWAVKALALSPFIIDFSGNLVRVVVLTPSRDRTLEPCAAAVEYLRDDLIGGVRRLRSELGMRSVLCEGGPRLLGDLLRARLVDELHLVIAPKLAGGADPTTTVAGAALDPPAGLRLLSLHESGDYLFLRYGA